MKPVVLTIAGSDSGGGAGIQMDLRVFGRLGVFGTTALTAVTAQNLSGVHAVEGVSTALVRAQVDAVLKEFPVRAVKTGMLWSKDTVEAVANVLEGHEIPLVVDPVMVATSGDLLLQPDAIAAYRRHLFPLATVLTPNLDEASVLVSDPALATRPPEEAGRFLQTELGAPVLLKGGHRPGELVDVLASRESSGSGAVLTSYRHPRVNGGNTHGSGCMLAAAVASSLAEGRTLVNACEKAIAFSHDALARGASGGAPFLPDVEAATPLESVVATHTAKPTSPNPKISGSPMP